MIIKDKTINSLLILWLSVFWILSAFSCSHKTHRGKTLPAPSSKIQKLYECKKYQKAESELKKRLKHVPEDLSSRLWLGKIYSAQYLHDRAREQFNIVLKAEPNNVEALQCLARVDSEEHRVESAMKNFKKALRLSPGDPSLYSDLGYYYVEHHLGEEKAEAAFKKALELSPDYVPALAGLGRLYCSILQYDRAEKYLKKALSLDPNFDLGHIFMGEVLFRKGKYPEAEAEYKKAIVVSPDNPNNYFELGEFYYDLGEFDRALATYRKGKVANPENRYSRIGALRVLAQVHIVRGDFDKAEKNLEELVRLDSENAPTRTVVGDLYFEQNRHESAEKEYLAALEANPRYPMAYTGLGHVYRARHEYKKAEEAFRKAIKMNSETPGGYLGLGELLNQLGRYDEAEEAYKKVLIINPVSLDALVGLGDTALGKGNLEKAFEIYQKALSRAGSRSASIHIAMAKALKEKGNLEEARKQLEMAGRINPYDADVECGIGDIELIRGNPGKAEVYFRRALEKFPGYSYALYRLSVSLLRQGKEEEAEKLGEKLLAMRQAVPDWTFDEKEIASIDPGARGLIYMGDLYTREKKFDKAESAYNEACKKMPSSDLPLIGLLEVYVIQGKWDNANDIYWNRLSDKGRKRAIRDPVIKEFINSPNLKPGTKK
ncbi:MAG: tetratricopeptide repeat protein [Candidatus Eremiobacteraeota bacterium]|nr:tetratricopeptide repeat protein [Candidatus Eremiobacteraeota bacterium]